MQRALKKDDRWSFRHSEPLSNRHRDSRSQVRLLQVSHRSPDLLSSRKHLGRPRVSTGSPPLPVSIRRRLTTSAGNLALLRLIPTVRP